MNKYLSSTLIVIGVLIIAVGGASLWYQYKDKSLLESRDDSRVQTQVTPSVFTGTSSVAVDTEDANAHARISATSPIKTADEVVIRGKAAKGIILNTKIRAVEVIDGEMSGIKKEVEIGSSGDFSISMPKGVILLQIVTRGGSIEKDEVLGVDVPLPLDFRFRAAVDLIDVTTKSVKVNITAYSEVAVVLAEKNGGLLPKNINRANSGIANIIGVDFISTDIIQSNDAVRLTKATQAEKKMSILNAAIADMASKDKMGCGPKQTHGETINCTIAKFAEQFNVSNW